jgi:ABC-type amino acid transport substrate-binding protein
MDDERIERALRLGPPDEPTYRTDPSWRGTGARHDPAAARGAVERSGQGELERLRPVVGRPQRRGGRPERWPLLAVAASLVLLVGGLLALSNDRTARDVGASPSPDLLARIRAAGTVEIAVRDSAPQTIVAGGSYIGFDIDVADAVVKEMGLAAETVAMPPGDVAARTWDLALPGHAARSLGGVVASTAYAYWPVSLAAPQGSPLTDLASLATARVCTVQGSAGYDWLAGDTVGAATAAPAGVTVVQARSDEECVTAVADGRAEALLTTTLLPDELGARGLRLVVPDPVVRDPWTVVVRGPASDVADLLAAVDGAIASLRESGRLADLSRASFGGLDLTDPQP